MKTSKNKRDYAKGYYKDNKEKYAEYYKKYYLENKDKILKKQNWPYLAVRYPGVCCG